LQGAHRWYAEYLQSDRLEPQVFLMLFIVEAWLAELEERASSIRDVGSAR
jgi:hypothetical protein